jgi:hypothetical protein
MSPQLPASETRWAFFCLCGRRKSAAGRIARHSPAAGRHSPKTAVAAVHRALSLACLIKGANVTIKDSYHWRKQLMWGLLLVGLGGALLLDQLNMLDVEDLWHYWPLVLIVLGVNKMIGYPTARDFTSGLWTAFIGIWLFANFERLFGMTFHNSWPYLVIAWGVTLILRPFIRERFAVNAAAKESSNEK